MDTVERPKLTFPRFRRAVLRHFSLFTRETEVTLDIQDGVFCLAGANGIGKSTVIAALNFALTGRVPDPDRSYKSVEEYYIHTEEFPDRFFTGRISEVDRQSAEVEIEFEVGNCRYRLVRGVFEPNQLRDLQISDGTNEDQDELVGSGQSELQGKFASHVTEKIGLSDFDQLVFLQLFLFTFDERRHLAFWDSEILEQFLFLAFGFDPGTAARADSLRRTIDRQDSIRRNRNYEATETRKRLAQLEAAAGDQQDLDEDITSQHEKLELQRDELEKSVMRLEAEIQDKKLAFADVSAAQAALQQEYEDTFQLRKSQQGGVHLHPLVITSVSAGECGLCGASSDDMGERILKNTERPECPLCGSRTNEGDEDSAELLESLKDMDKRISDGKNKLRIESQALRRLGDKRGKLFDQLTQADEDLTGFEKQNAASFLRNTSDTSEELEAAMDAHRRQIKDLLAAKDAARDARDEAKTSLRALHRTVTDRYQDAETEFVPLFKELAHEFLGLDVDVQFEAKAARIGLSLEVEGTARREHYQLSESQRFFVDIALRMALAQFMCSEGGSASFLIDTPEGSLDAAYESRAGSMFARFVESGHNIVMTANINTSQLLLRLAERCGTARMQLCRMTDWTELSDVQVEEEDLFEKAYSEIEKALKGGPTNTG